MGNRLACCSSSTRSRRSKNADPPKEIFTTPNPSKTHKRTRTLSPKCLNSHLESRLKIRSRLQSSADQYTEALSTIDLFPQKQDSSSLKSWCTGTSIESIESIYTLSKKPIGVGHFGSVYKASLNISPSKIYAVKTIKKNDLPRSRKLLKRELKILRSIDHPHIIQFYECYQDYWKFHYVTEYCAG